MFPRQSIVYTFVPSPLNVKSCKSVLLRLSPPPLFTSRITSELKSIDDTLNGILKGFWYNLVPLLYLA